jgi:hypothetical protein
VFKGVVDRRIVLQALGARLGVGRGQILRRRHRSDPDPGTRNRADRGTNPAKGCADRGPRRATADRGTDHRERVAEPVAELVEPAALGLRLGVGLVGKGVAARCLGALAHRCDRAGADPGKEPRPGVVDQGRARRRAGAERIGPHLLVGRHCLRETWGRSRGRWRSRSSWCVRDKGKSRCRGRVGRGWSWRWLGRRGVVGDQC